MCSTLHPALHRTGIPMRVALVMPSTMWPINVVGRPGMLMSQMCPDETLLPSVKLIVMGVTTHWRFLTGVHFIIKIDVAPVSAMACNAAIAITFAYSKHWYLKKLSKNRHPMFRPLSGPHAWLYLQTYRGKLEFLIPYALQYINRCPLTLTKKMLLKYHTNCILSCSNASPIESPKRCPNTLTKIPQRDGYLSLFSHFVLQSAKAYCESAQCHHKIGIHLHHRILWLFSLTT